MTVEQLQEYRLIINEFEDLSERVECLEHLISVTHRGTSNILFLDSLERLRSLYVEHVAKLISAQCKIELFIQSVDSVCVRDIMRLKYIDGCDWEEVAERVNYSSRHCQRLVQGVLDESRGV